MFANWPPKDWQWNATSKAVRQEREEGEVVVGVIRSEEEGEEGVG